MDKKMSYLKHENNSIQLTKLITRNLKTQLNIYASKLKLTKLENMKTINM